MQVSVFINRRNIEFLLFGRYKKLHVNKYIIWKNSNVRTISCNSLFVGGDFVHKMNFSFQLYVIQSEFDPFWSLISFLLRRRRMPLRTRYLADDSTILMMVHFTYRSFYIYSFCCCHYNNLLLLRYSSARYYISREITVNFGDKICVYWIWIKNTNQS